MNDNMLSGQVGRPYISASQIDMYLTCGEAYRRRYIDNEVSPPGIAIVKGKSGHYALQVNNEQKITSRTDLTVDQFQDAIATSVESEFNSEISLTKEESTVGLSKLKAGIKDEMVGLAPLMAQSAALVQPIEVEQRQEIELPGALSKNLVFVMDVLTEDGGIVDYKFTGRRKNQSDIDTNTGLSAYALAYLAQKREYPKSIRFHNFVSAKKTELNILDTKRTERDILAFIAVTEQVIKAIDAGVFNPAPAGSWKCSPRFCGYWGNCKYVNQERHSAAESELK